MYFSKKTSRLTTCLSNGLLLAEQAVGNQQTAKIYLTTIWKKVLPRHSTAFEDTFGGFQYITVQPCSAIIALIKITTPDYTDVE